VGSTLTTTEKAFFIAHEPRSGLRKRAAEMETPLELRMESWSSSQRRKSSAGMIEMGRE